MKCNLIFYILIFTLLQNLYAQTIDSTAIKSIEKDTNPYMIDYPNLDTKYYPYIKAQNKYYDKDIVNIIHNVDLAERKSAFFVGILYGFSVNVTTPFNDLVGRANANFGLFSLRAGYQNYMGSVLPVNTFGYRVYIDFCNSFGKGGLFFTSINTDVLWDVLEDSVLNFGLGIGGAKIAGFMYTEPAIKLNFGFSIRYLHHQKIGLYLGEILYSMQGLGLTFTIGIGYDYAF